MKDDEPNQKAPRDPRDRPRVAVLVLHGIGQQAKFETLAAFAAGLAQTAGVCDVTRTPLLLDDRLESALTLSLPDAEVDLVEYHYQPLMQRQVAMADVTRWLVETGFHIRRIYRTYRFKAEDPKGARQPRPDADGDFLRLHYMLCQRGDWMVGILWVLAALLNALEHLRNVRFTGLLRAPLRAVLGRLVDPVLREVAGDLVLYTAYDPRLALSAVRDQVLKGCADRIEGLVRCTSGGRLRYQKVFVAGHSLGSVVAYDAISRLAMRADHALASGVGGTHTFTPSELERMGGLITFGSPLDKVALTFWPCGDEQDLRSGQLTTWDRRRIVYRRGLLAHFHGIRGLSHALPLPEVVRQPATCSLNGLPWLNVHHPEDLIAGHLDAFEGVVNLQITPEIKASFAASRTAQAHASYWSDPAMYAWLLGQFGALPPRPVAADTSSAGVA